MITRILITAALVLSCSICIAEDFPEDTNEIKSLTAEQAAELVGMNLIGLELNGLTSIDRDVAQELAKVKGGLFLRGLTSINKDVAQELAKFEGEGLDLNGLTSTDKDVAQALGKFKGKLLLLRPLAFQTYEEENGESPSVKSRSVIGGGMF